MTADEIKLKERAGLKILRVQEHLASAHAALLKPHGLSLPQYNVLRILRGAQGEDLRCHDVKDRMITRVPDVTRLLDRLEQRDLIERWRCADDRRVVRTRITRAGLEMLARIDAPLRTLWGQQFAALTPRKLAQLDRLLDALLDDD